MTFVSLIIIKA